jgi:hypothetical protein
MFRFAQHGKSDAIIQLELVAAQATVGIAAPLYATIRGRWYGDFYACIPRQTVAAAERNVS